MEAWEDPAGTAGPVRSIDVQRGDRPEHMPGDADRRAPRGLYGVRGAAEAESQRAWLVQQPRARARDSAFDHRRGQYGGRGPYIYLGGQVRRWHRAAAQLPRRHAGRGPRVRLDATV